MNDHVGQQLGNYRLIRLLGQGGFADVYLGEHIYLRTPAAIKVLQARLVKADLQEFLNEARSIANLVHPNIVRVLEFGVEGDTPYLVMDYAPNGTLRQRHPKGEPVPPAVVASYIKQVASSLQYAHDQRLVHRDIKPENMLIGRNNEILLSDFGIAVVAQSSRYQQSGQEVGGTIAYMAPEQLQGRAVPASDQYALGIVVYEWLCGERPFRGSFPEIASQHMMAQPASLRSRIPGMPTALEEVVMRALAKNPQERFIRVDAFANALEQACQAVPPLWPAQNTMGRSMPGFSTTIPAQADQSTYPAMQQRQSPSGNYGPTQQGQVTPNFGATGGMTGSNLPSGNYGPTQQGQVTPNFGATGGNLLSGNYGPTQQGQVTPNFGTMGGTTGGNLLSGNYRPTQQGQVTPNFGAMGSNQQLDNSRTLPAGSSSPNVGPTYGNQPPGNYGPSQQGQPTTSFTGMPPNQPSGNYAPGQFAPNNLPNKPPTQNKGISRRAFVLGAAGVAGVVIIGGGAVLAFSHNSGRTATNTATPTSAVSANNNTPTAVPSPTDTPTPDVAATATAEASVTPDGSATPSEAPTVQTTPGTVLYQANWSNGLDGWSGTGDWKTLNTNLLNDGSNTNGLQSAPTILVPTSLAGIPNYAVEAVIQIQSSSGYGPSFGFVVRTAAQNTGYLAGVGNNSSDNVNTARISDASNNTSYDFFNSLRSSPFDPGTKAHTYRVEVKGNDIKLLIDGGLAVELFDNRYLTGERTGLWCQGAQLTIQSYKVVAL